MNNKGKQFASAIITLIFLPFLFLAATAVEQTSLITESLEKIISDHGIPGIHLTLIRNDQSTTYTAGFADLEQDIAMQKEHRMLIGSTGKTFVSALCLQLAENGKLSLEDKASKYLSKYEWFMQLPNAKSITIKHLLQHSSGLPEYVYAQELWQQIKNDSNKIWNAENRLQYIANTPALFEAGQGWSYADANYIVLGALIEEVLESNLYDQIGTAFITPEKLIHTEASDQQDLTNLTAGYTGGFFGRLFQDKVSHVGRYNFNPQFEWAGGGFVSNSQDLAAWTNRLYKARILNTASTTVMFDAIDRTKGQPNSTGYGLGTEIFETRYGTAYGHTGFMPGFQTFMAQLPKHDLTIAFQINIDPYSAKIRPGTSVHVVADKILSLFIQPDKKADKATTIYFVRHAEKENDGTNNPSLNEEGKRRAVELSEFMQTKSIDAIYASPYKRTLETAAPLSEQLGVVIQQYNPNDLASIFEIIAQNKGENVLIVGHSNTIPMTINFLGQTNSYQQINEEDFHHIYKLKYSSKVFEVEQTVY